MLPWEAQEVPVTLYEEYAGCHFSVLFFVSAEQNLLTSIGKNSRYCFIFTLMMNNK